MRRLSSIEICAGSFEDCGRFDAVCGAGSCLSAWDCSQETPILIFGITGHQPVFRGTTEVGNHRDSSDIEKSARDKQLV